MATSLPDAVVTPRVVTVATSLVLNGSTLAERLAALEATLATSTAATMFTFASIADQVVQPNFNLSVPLTITVVESSCAVASVVIASSSNKLVAPVSAFSVATGIASIFAITLTLH